MEGGRPASSSTTFLYHGTCPSSSTLSIKASTTLPRRAGILRLSRRVGPASGKNATPLGSGLFSWLWIIANSYASVMSLPPQPATLRLRDPHGAGVRT